MCRRVIALQFMRHPLVKFVSAAIYLVGVLLLFFNFRYDWWSVSIFTAAISVVYFRPLSVAIGLASISLLMQQIDIYKMISAVSSEWPFHPYTFYPNFMPLTIFAASGAAISFTLRWALGLLRKGLMGKEYGGRRALVDTVLAATLYVAVASLLYASTHRENEVEIRNLYEAMLGNSVTKLTSIASGPTVSTDQRVAAVLALSGLATDGNNTSERQRALTQIKMDSVDSNYALNLAAKLALGTLETFAEIGEIDLPFYSDARIKEVIFVNQYQLVSRHIERFGEDESDQ